MIGAGSAFVYSPLLVATMRAVTPEAAPKAASFIVLAFQLGGSISSAGIVAFFDRREQFHQTMLAAETTISRLPVAQFLQHGSPCAAGRSSLRASRSTLLCRRLPGDRCPRALGNPQRAALSAQKKRNRSDYQIVERSGATRILMITKDLPGGTYAITPDLTVTRMGYGAMQLAGSHVFGPPADYDAAVAVLREAIDLGITHIDTSDYYGPHVTNEIIKEALYPYPADLHE